MSRSSRDGGQAWAVDYAEQIGALTRTEDVRDRQPLTRGQRPRVGAAPAVGKHVGEMVREPNQHLRCGTHQLRFISSSVSHGARSFANDDAWQGQCLFDERAFHAGQQRGRSTAKRFGLPSTNGLKSNVLV